MASPRYRKEYPELARGLAALGASPQMMADNWGIKLSKLNEWRKKYRELDQAIQDGYAPHSVAIAQALIKRATGYVVKEKTQKVKRTLEGDEETISITEKYIPPDMKAVIFWLTNREPKLWSLNPTSDGGGGNMVELNPVYNVIPDDNTNYLKGRK